MSNKISTFILVFIVLTGLLTPCVADARKTSKIKKTKANNVRVKRTKRHVKKHVPEKPALEPQARKTEIVVVEKKSETPTKKIIKEEPAIYNEIKNWIGKDDDEEDDEWLQEQRATKGTISGDFGEFSSGLKTAMQNHAFKVGNTPFSVQGLPILYPSSTGLNIGGRIGIYDLTYENPYRYNLMVQYWISDRGRRNHEVRLDIPHFFSKDWHIFFSYRYKLDIDANYFGTGNDSIYNHNLVNQNSSSFISKSFYKYVFTHPDFIVQLQYKLPVEKILIFIGIGLQKNEIAPLQYSTSTDAPYLLQNDPHGLNGGKTNYINAGIMYDTRDYPTNPDSGSVLAFIHTRHAGFMQSDYIYESSNITYMRFNYFWRYFTLAQRTIFEGMKGDVPFFALGSLFSTEPMEGLGGGDTLRGFPTFRYVDRLKFVNQFELRIRFYNGVVSGQLLRVDIVPYWDMGRVWSRIQLFQINDIHHSFGSSFRLTWNKNFLIALTFGASKDGFETNLGFGENFH